MNARQSIMSPIYHSPAAKPEHWAAIRDLGLAKYGRPICLVGSQEDIRNSLLWALEFSRDTEIPGNYDDWSRDPRLGIVLATGKLGAFSAPLGHPALDAFEAATGATLPFVERFGSRTQTLLFLASEPFPTRHLLLEDGEKATLHGVGSHFLAVGGLPGDETWRWSMGTDPRGYIDRVEFPSSLPRLKIQQVQTGLNAVRPFLGDNNVEL